MDREYIEQTIQDLYEIRQSTKSNAVQVAIDILDELLIAGSVHLDYKDDDEFAELFIEDEEEYA